MALKPLNSVAGFSVGETPANIILANGDITTTNITTTGVANLNNIGNVKIFGGSNGQVISTDGSGNLSYISIDSAAINNGNSNVRVFSNSNVTISVSGNANVATFTGTGANISGYLTVEGTITANGNLSANNYLVTPTSKDLIIAPDTQLIRSYANINPYNDNAYNLGNGLARWVNVYSYESNVTGNANVGSLRTDNLLYANGQPWDLQEAAGSNTQIQYNDGSNNFGASANFTYDDGTQQLYVNGTANIVGNVTAGNVDGGNLVKANNFSTNGTGGDITLTGGNVTGANVVIANSFTSNGGTIDFATNNPNVNLGNVPNVHILGGSAGQVLQTDGAGNLTWTSSANVNQIHNGDSNVTIPDVSGNVYINANSGVDQQWNFGTDGVLYTPGNIQLGGHSIVDNASQGIQLYSTTNYAQLNYNNSTYVYTQNDGVWLDTGVGKTVNLDTAGNVTMTGNLSVQGNIANANNITTTNDLTVGGNANVVNNLSVGGNIVTGTGSGGNISGVDVLTANTVNANIFNTGEIANGTSNIRLAQNSNVTISVNNTSNVFTFSDAGANVIGYVQANGIISAGGFVGSNLVSNVGILSLQAQQGGGDYNINLLAGGNGTVDVGNVRITSLATPNASTDAATKQYVDDVAQGLDIKASVSYATATALPAYTYNNGTSGVGATITANANGALSIDGGSPSATQRVLIKNEVGDVSGANSAYNGIYVVTNAGGAGAPFVLTRATDFDNGAPSGEIPGGFTFVELGSTNADTGWVCTTNNPVTMGTTPITFTQFSGAGSYTGANGVAVIGTVISANVDNDTTAIVGGNITVKVGANLVTPNIGAATGTSLDLTGNLTAGNITSNATITGVDASLTGNVTVGGNITTTGTTGNISGANVIFANSFTSNGGTIDFATNNPNVQLGDVSNVHITGGTSGYLLTTDGAGNLSWSATASTSLIFNGNSNVTIPTTDGNVYINANSGTDQQWNFDTTGNLTTPGQIITPTVNANTSVIIGNSEIRFGNVTTTSISANQTISSYTLTGTGVSGIEWIVKAVDNNLVAPKYSVATLLAVTDGTNVDYTVYGSVQLGGYTGSLAVNIVGSTVRLQVTPSSSNSTVWTTQYRLI